MAQKRAVKILLQERSAFRSSEKFLEKNLAPYSEKVTIFEYSDVDINIKYTCTLKVNSESKLCK